jgi:hypothetical protein
MSNTPLPLAAAQLKLREETLRDLIDANLLPSLTVNGQAALTPWTYTAMLAMQDTDACWAVQWPELIQGDPEKAAGMLHTLSALTECFTYEAVHCETPDEHTRLYMSALVRVMVASCRELTKVFDLEVKI